MGNRGRKDLRGSDRVYFSIKHFLYFCEMENDKNIQLRDFSSMTGQCLFYIITMKFK